MASSRRELSQQIRGFAQDLQDCLNRTITNGISLTAKLREDGKEGWIFYDPSSTSPRVGEPVPLTIGKPSAQLGLRILHTLCLDDEAKYLTVVKSSYTVYAWISNDWEPLFHYDYVRGSQEYPEAHLQVKATNETMDEVFTRRGRQNHASFERLHFPVGPRRYRPTLEDVVAFLVSEELVDARDRWEVVVEQGRRSFGEEQLRAAVRRAPEVAGEQLAREGWTVHAPE